MIISHYVNGYKRIMLKQELQLYEDGEPAPVELDDSVYNPANDEFKRTLHALQNGVRRLAVKTTPRYAMIARVSLASNSNTEIAKRVRCHPTTVGKALRDPIVMEIRKKLIHINTLLSGSTAIEREQLLWRIAMKNEDIDPKTSISAIAEINKMKVDTEAAQQQIKDVNQISDHNKPQITVQFVQAEHQPEPKLINPTVIEHDTTQEDN